MDILDNFKYLIPLELKYYTTEPYVSSPLRRSKVMLFCGSMREYVPFRNLSIRRQMIKINNVEKSCYNATIKKMNERNIMPTWKSKQFVHAYESITQRVAQSIDCTSGLKCTFLINAVTNNTIDINIIGTAAIDILCPNANIDLKRKIVIRRKQVISVKTSTLYTCPNCKPVDLKVKVKGQVKVEVRDNNLYELFEEDMEQDNKDNDDEDEENDEENDEEKLRGKTTYRTKQLRGADEASSTIITCLWCDHVWVIH